MLAAMRSGHEEVVATGMNVLSEYSAKLNSGARYWLYLYSKKGNCLGNSFPLLIEHKYPRDTHNSIIAPIITFYLNLIT